MRWRLAYCRENPYQLITHWIREPEPETTLRHEVRRQLDLVLEVGLKTPNERLTMHLPNDARDEARRLIALHDWRTDGPLVVVHPGASAASRRYSAAGFAEAVRLISQQLGARVVVTGSQAERSLVAEVCATSGCRCLPLPGVMKLETFSALISEAALLISNNTGPVHIAAALGTPVVDLFALTNPQHTPWMVPSRVLFHDVSCKYCYKSQCPSGHHDCLARVPPAAVADAAAHLLAGRTACSPEANHHNLVLE